MNRMQNILGSFYGNGTVLDVALCSNDSTALGVTKAIASDYAGTNQPIITGQDGDEANLKNIVDGKQSMTVYKAVANEAVVTMALAQAMLNGETPSDALASTFDFALHLRHQVLRQRHRHHPLLPADPDRGHQGQHPDRADRHRLLHHGDRRLPRGRGLIRAANQLNKTQKSGRGNLPRPLFYFTATRRKGASSWKTTFW